MRVFHSAGEARICECSFYGIIGAAIMQGEFIHNFEHHCFAIYAGDGVAESEHASGTSCEETICEVAIHSAFARNKENKGTGKIAAVFSDVVAGNGTTVTTTQ